MAQSIGSCFSSSDILLSLETSVAKLSFDLELLTLTTHIKSEWEGGSCLGTHIRIKDFKIKKKKKE